MSARTATVNILVDGKAMDKEQRSTVTSVTYTDPASGKADSLDIAVSGGGNKWITDWYPGEGKVLSATIALSDWEQEGAQDITLDCGKFILDEPKFSGWPVSGHPLGCIHPCKQGVQQNRKNQDMGKRHAKGNREKHRRPGRNCAGLGCFWQQFFYFQR